MSLGKWAKNWMLVWGASKGFDNWCQWFGEYGEDWHCGLAKGAAIHAHLMALVVSG